jgi:hypothetical protein
MAVAEQRRDKRAIAGTAKVKRSVAECPGTPQPRNPKAGESIAASVL